ncbi:MAG: hypothetical protein ACJ75J_08240 [Cytophagaceae bacterium]
MKKIMMLFLVCGLLTGSGACTRKDAKCKKEHKAAKKKGTAGWKY